MALQCGEIVITGTIDNLCFYERDGKYYVRKKPGPDKKQFNRYNKYKIQRESAEWMKSSACIVSQAYAAIPKSIRTYSLFCQLQKRVFWLFRIGMDVRAITAELVEYLVQEGYLSFENTCQMKAFIDGVTLKQKPVLRNNQPDHNRLSNVCIRVREGKWIRIYAREELELLQKYASRIRDNEAWLTEFLREKKLLRSTRLRSRRMRRRRKAVLKKKPSYRSDSFQCTLLNSKKFQLNSRYGTYLHYTAELNIPIELAELSTKSIIPKSDQALLKESG